MSAFVDEQRDRFGVEPICRALGVSASAYYQRATGELSVRRVEDERLLALIREIHRRNYFAYGSWRMWKALRRAGEQTGRGHVERLFEYVAWFNNGRLHTSLGGVPPAEYEAQHLRQ